MELTARLTADATIFTTKNNKQVVHFTVALNHRYRSGGQTKTQTDYYRCSYWASTGVTSFLKQGVLLSLTGRVTASSYINSQGKAIAQLNLNVEKMSPLTSSKSGPATTSNSVQVPALQPEPSQMEDLPF